MHFLEDAPAKSVAYKTVAVNLSDLAAMGAEPAWISLSLSLPTVNDEWLSEFVDGLYELTQYYSVQLIGGDTVKGPMAMTITAQGFIPPGSELTRSNAKPGDWVYVTGTLGDAGAGLDILQNKLNVAGEARDVLINRHYYPTPRVAMGTALRRIASSCIDVSDGLISDLGHILKASGCGANVHVDKLPLSRALTSAVDNAQAIEYALSAGDDYELIFTVGEEQRGNFETSMGGSSVKATCIASIFGIYLCGKTADDMQVHDHGSIVWDEVAGMFITFLFVPITAPSLLAGFVLFRIFDILKPWPIGPIDKRLHGGTGIMLDDIVAGAMACACLHIMMMMWPAFTTLF